MATKFTPLHDRILVRRVEEADTTRGGIIIPDSAKDKPQEGEVISAGKGKISEDIAPGGVEVDHLHQRICGEALDPIVEVVELQSFLLALHQLHNFAAHQVDRRNQHGHLTATPAPCSSCFSCAMSSMPK